MYVQAANEIRHNSLHIPINSQHQVLILELNVCPMVCPVVQPGETQNALGKAICSGALNINNFACKSAAADQCSDMRQLNGFKVFTQYLTCYWNEVCCLDMHFQCPSVVETITHS